MRAWLVAVFVAMLLAGCTPGAESQAAQPPTAVAETLESGESLPAPTSSVIDTGLIDDLGEPISDDRLRLFARWQGNLAFEGRVRHSILLAEIFFRPDGSQNDDDTIKAQVRLRLGYDPFVLDTLAAVEADFAGGNTDTGLFASELAIRVIERDSSPGGGLAGMPSTEELESLVAAGNERLDPLRDGYLDTSGNAIAAGTGLWLFGLGIDGKDVTTEYIDPAKALPVGSVLQDAIADLEAAIPDEGIPGNEAEVSRAFARFALALGDLVGEPALAGS